MALARPQDTFKRPMDPPSTPPTKYDSVISKNISFLQNFRDVLQRLLQVNFMIRGTTLKNNIMN
jgi:hypothetical protein